MKVLLRSLSAQYERRIKIAETRAKFHKLWLRIALVCTKISEKFSRNSFLLQFHVRISTEFGTKRDKFRVKRISIHPRKKSNSFTHKRTFLSALAVINKNFIACLVGPIWGSNLSQNSIDTVTTVWTKFQTKTPKEKGVLSPRQSVNRTGFPKTKRPDFFSPYLLFVVRLWTSLLTWVKTTYESTCVKSFSAIRTQNKNCRN